MYLIRLKGNLFVTPHLKLARFLIIYIYIYLYKIIVIVYNFIYFYIFTYSWASLYIYIYTYFNQFIIRISPHLKLFLMHALKFFRRFFFFFFPKNSFLKILPKLLNSEVSYIFIWIIHILSCFVFLVCRAFLTWASGSEDFANTSYVFDIK